MTVMVSQLPQKGGVEFLLCMAAGTRGARAASRTKLTPNGLGGVSTIFLRSIRVRDVVVDYIETQIEALPEHKFDS